MNQVSAAGGQVVRRLKRRVTIAGVNFDALQLAEAIAWLRSRRRSNPFAYVVTPNADHIVRLCDFPAWQEMHEAYDYADLCLCDSQVVSRLARLRSIALPVVAGSELLEALFSRGALRGCRVALVGGSGASISRLRDLADDVDLVQHIPPMGLMANQEAMDECVRFVEQAGADYIFLCVGSPQQELIARRLALGGSTGGTALCVGAALGFLTGELRRAPRWMQKAALEWLYRLLVEPRRLWRRYLLHSSRILILMWR